MCGGLPIEIWDVVLTWLTPRDLVTLAQLNSTFNNVVTNSIPWRFYRTLFPTSRKIWALSWTEAHEGYFARTIPPTGREPTTFHDLNLPQDQLFSTLFLGTNRRIIEFLGPSVRHRHNTFVTQTDFLARSCRSWRIKCTQEALTGQVVSVQKVDVNLPPRGHHLRPAGLDVVGTFLFWVDYADQPLDFSIAHDGIQFDDEIGENVLWPDRVFDETGGELCLLHMLFLSWGESRFEFSGQMVSAVASIGPWGRKQILRLFDYERNRAYSIPFDDILGDQGPWLGEWRSPWILPWGFDDDGNLLFKILDTRIVHERERIRCVQTSYNLESMRTTFSVEIFEDIQLLNPWNFQMFSDQCWGYPVRDRRGNVWCILRDLRDGNIVRRVGPLNSPGTQPTDYACHISMFHVIFQDKSTRFASRKKPAHTPLRIFPINPVLPAVQCKHHLPIVEKPSFHAQLLYELSPPSHPEPPDFWTFGGEEAAERYLFFQGATKDNGDNILYPEWKKWIVWDSVRREWSILKCKRDWEVDGYFVLFSEIDGDTERVGLDWVRMELPG
jgi:hypothetical protein